MNTGFKKYTILEQYNLDTGQLTGITKPNSPLDPDYINNVFDTISCPITTSTTSTTTTTTSTSTTTTSTTTTTTTTPLEATLTQISNIRIGSERQQIFRVGLDVPIGVTYRLSAYNHNVDVISVLGDDVETITLKLIDAVNNTSELDWNSAGGAPISGTLGFPPTAVLISYNEIELTLNFRNSFTSSTL